MEPNLQHAEGFFPEIKPYPVHTPTSVATESAATFSVLMLTDFPPWLWRPCPLLRSLREIRGLEIRGEDPFV